MFIKDICDKAGLSSSTVRYYDKLGLLGEVKRQSNNYRIFDNRDLEILIFIKKARNLGFELDEIKNILNMKSKGIEPCNYVNKRMHEKISQINDEIHRLEMEKKDIQKHLVDAQKITGCHGSVCHYIEGIEEETTENIKNNDCCSSKKRLKRAK